MILQPTNISLSFDMPLLSPTRQHKELNQDWNRKEKNTTRVNLNSWSMEFSRSFRLSKSHRILLSSEYVTLECGYERLSQSMRLTGEYDFSYKLKKNKKGLGLLGKVFSFARISSPHEEPKKVAERVVKKEKKRSSWLPDPGRRWPIQGW
ncbi:unnamed protein product [Sphenostylis stenocarpa]|uniref:Uncharacterized protein n=1 Tax=Sphenostylis stenocarpa TaxID=92480 RepID=A0AA86S0T0_9FABA|nr:unnamed protein product [Sphenostylis stenocarpa]